MIAAQLTAEASTIIFEAATAYLKALIAAVKKVNKEVNIQVKVEDDKQSNSKVLDEDEQSFQYKHYKMSRQSLDYIKLKLHFINTVGNAA